MGQCILGEIALLIGVDKEKQCWVSCRQPSLRRSAIALENTAERIQVLQGLKQIGAYIGDLRV